MNEQKDVKGFKLTVFIGIMCAILYATVMIGDGIATATGGEISTIRYILVAIVTIIGTFCLVKFNIKRYYDLDGDIMLNQIKIAPIIIALIILGYGIYSVDHNMKKIENNYVYRLYSYIDEEKTKEMVDKAKTDAIINWVITAVIHLICAESVVFLAKNKTLQIGNFDTQPTMQQSEMQRNTGNLAFGDATYSNNTNYGQMNSNTINQGVMYPNGINHGTTNSNAINQGTMYQNGMNQATFNQGVMNQGSFNQGVMNQATFNQSGMNQKINNQNEINSNSENNTNIN